MIFKAIQNHDPEKTALQGDVRSISYGELSREIDMRVDALFGVRSLAIALDNSLQWVLWDLAALKAEIPCVPLLPFFTKNQVSHSLQSAGVSHILDNQGLRATGLECENSVMPEGCAKVTFTSGTTGTPKGVCLSKSAFENVASSIVEVLGTELAGIHVSILPLGVLLENVAGVYASLIAGCTIALPSLNEFGENYSNLHTVLKKNKATSIILVPEILRTLMIQVVTKGPIENLQFIAVGGSKIDPALIWQARAMALPVYEGYGLSECASVVAMNTPKNDKTGTVGKPLPHVKAFIDNDEFVFKTDGFLGYIGENKPKSYHSGDLGEFDDDGFLKISGRKKNVLITSYGRNVSPEWVEATLLAQPEIAQVIVYGDAQTSLSALIVPSYQGADIERSIQAANQTLPDYAQIKDFKLVPPFTAIDGTLTGTGRPRREKILNLHNIKENTHELLRSTC